MDSGLDLYVWDEHTDQKIFMIGALAIISIERVMTTNTFIIKSKKGDVHAFTIKDLKPKKYSLQKIISNNYYWNISNLADLIVTDSHLLIAGTKGLQGRSNK
jgi:hypothetical protein